MIKFKKRTKISRQAFCRAVDAIREDREWVFAIYAVPMASRIAAGGPEELRKISHDMVQNGIYSGRTPLKTVELAVMKKLYRIVGRRGETWAKFVNRTVGPKWSGPRWRFPGQSRAA
jgi:hypothetical protein